MERNSIKKNYIYNMLFQVLNLLLPFVTTPYVSRVLQADNIGIYSYTYSIITTFVLFGSLGVATYGQKEIAAAGDDKKKISQLFWEISCIKICAISVSAIIYFLMAFTSSRYMIYFVVQFPYFISSILDISWYYQGIEDFKYVAIRSSIVKILSTAFIFLFVKSCEDLIEYLLILCVSQTIGNVPMWVRLKREVSYTKVHFCDLKKHIRPTMVYFIPSIATQVYAVLDKTMLGIILQSDAENGYYEQAHKIINMTMSVVTAYTIVMRSRMSFLFAQKHYDEIKKRTQDSMHFVCMLVFPMGFGLAGIAKNFVPWFLGDGYDNVVYIIYAFCPLYVFLGICTCIGTHILTPSGKQNKSNIGQVTGAVANICLNLMLIPRLFSVGAAAASTVTELIILIVYLHYSREYIRLSKIIRISSKYFIAGLGMFSVIMIVSTEMQSSILNTLVLILLGVVTYFVLLLVFRDSYFRNKLEFFLSELTRRKQL